MRKADGETAKHQTVLEGTPLFGVDLSSLSTMKRAKPPHASLSVGMFCVEACRLRMQGVQNALLSVADLSGCKVKPRSSRKPRPLHYRLRVKVQNCTLQRPDKTTNKMLELDHLGTL